jgi:hypothetical protein
LDAPIVEFPESQRLTSPGFRQLSGELSVLVAEFVQYVVSENIEIYNEFSLQHELGLFLRGRLPELRVQFERNVKFFSKSDVRFSKQEIDLAIFSKDKSELKYAIELKFPRNGQRPESIFAFCKDVAFIEELRTHGFAGAAAVIFVDDQLFYDGSSDGIYGHFRCARPITGRIGKPTGKKDEVVYIQGSYEMQWKDVEGRVKYACIEL